MEKAYEHRTKIFCIFVDLRKAYDSVPRAALYHALSVLGIPLTLLKVIESFDDGMGRRCVCLGVSRMKFMWRTA